MFTTPSFIEKVKQNNLSLVKSKKRIEKRCKVTVL